MQRIRYVILAVLVVVLVSPTIPTQAYPVSGYSRIYEGIEYATGYATSPRNMRAFATRISLQNPDVWIYASHDNGGAPYEVALQTTPSFLGDHGLKAGVNTCFYNAGLSPNTDILGLLVSNGTPVSPTDMGLESQMCFDYLKNASLVDRDSTPDGVYNGCGTGGRILSNGSFVGDVADLQPRTALGLSQDNKYLIMVVVDGRQPGWSDGANFYDLAQWLIDFGAYNGANFDGGGSTTLSIWGMGLYVNRPCYGYARSVGANLGAGSIDCGSIGPAACANSANRIDVLTRGSANGPYVKTYTPAGGWAPLVNLGGGTLDTPAICWWNTNSMSAFLRGINNQMHINTWNGNSWSGWSSLGGNCTSGPAACSWGPGRIDTFVRGSDNAMWWSYYNNGVWTNAGSLGGNCTSAPAACSWGSGRIDTFVRGSDNAIWHQSYSDGTWSAGASLGGYATSAPAACSWGSGRIDTVVRGSDNALYWQYYQNGNWSAGTSLGGVCAGAPTICSPGAGTLYVFVRGTNDHLYQNIYANSAWSGYYDLGAYY